jgi:eukaryotic-like serine/threonine-protein kinase
MTKLRADFLDQVNALGSELFTELLQQGDALEAPDELPKGERVGAYVIDRLIGRGGMSLVYCADRADGAFQQRVALKLIAFQKNPANALLLEREREHLASLEHPNIARLIDGGETASGVLWYAMEYIDGQSLLQYADQHQLALRDRLRLFQQLCDAVQYAHRQLLVHRDIKNNNVLVRSDGRLVLVDFGIAGSLIDPDQDAARGSMTPAIAAPEQQRGENATTAIDIYQLGKLLRLLVPEASASVRAIADKASAVEATQRYPSADALRVDIDRYLQHRLVSALPTSMWHRTGLFVRRNFAWLAVAAIACVTIGLTVWLFTERLQAEKRAAQLDAQTAKQVSDYLTRLFEAASPARHVGKPLTALQLLNLGRDRIDADLRDQPELHGNLSAVLGKIYASLEDYQAAIPLLENAIASINTSTDLLEAAERESLLAISLSNTPDIKRAETLMQTALDRLTPGLAREPRYRQILRRSAWLQMRLGNQAQAIALNESLLAALQQSADATVVESIQVRLNLGQMLGVAGQSERALALLQSPVRFRTSRFDQCLRWLGRKLSASTAFCAGDDRTTRSIGSYQTSLWCSRR